MMDSRAVYGHDIISRTIRYVQSRQAYELAGEAGALQALRSAKNGTVSSHMAITRAIAALRSSSAYGKTQHGQALKSQIFALRDALNASALLCPGCPDGGAGTICSQSPTLNLQNLDSPLSSAPWLAQRLERVRVLASESARRQALGQLLLPHWPIEVLAGSHYDWVGSIESQDRPHLLIGEGMATDPMHYFTPLHSGSGCTGRHYPPGSVATRACLASVPLKRMSKIGVSKGQTLQMRWAALDSRARYTLHLAFPGPLTHDAYGSETDHGFDKPVQLWAGRSLVYDGLPVNITILALPVPRNETAGGELTFTCDTRGSEKARSNMFQFLFGVDCKLSEVWLVREPDG